MEFGLGVFRLTSLLRLYRDAFAGLPREIWLISLVGFINRAGTMVMAFVGVWLAEVHHLPAGEAAQFLAIWGLGSCVGVPLGGRLTDRIGAVPVQVMSFVGVSFAFMALPGLGGLWEVGGVLFLVGLLGEAFRPANGAMLASFCAPELRTRAYALHRLAINAGWAIGPVAGGLVSEYWGWEPLFVIDAATCTAAGFLVWWWFGARPVAPVEDDDDASAGKQSPWADPVFVALVGAVFLLALAFLQFMSTLPVYLGEALRWGKDDIGFALAFNPILIAALEMILVQKLQRPNPLPIMAVGAAFVGLGLGMIWIDDGFLWIVFCVCLITFGEMLESPFTAGLVANRAPANARGRYMGAYGLMFSIAFIVAPLGGGGLVEAVSWDALWLSCGVLGLLGSGVLLALRRRFDGG